MKSTSLVSWGAADMTEAEFAAAVDSRSSKPIYERMKQAKVGIAGCGGLGSNIAAALVRAGLGNLVIADFDTIELSNINRQLYLPSQVGKPKAETLEKMLHDIDPYCEVEVHDVHITKDNAAEIFGDCQIVCEAFDVPENKSMLVNTLLENCPDMQVVSGVGMAGIGRANDIVTKRFGRLTVCGDGRTDVADGEGLSAARVIICAGHMASAVLEMILER